MNHSKSTLGEMLSAKSETVRRNALSILKIMQNCNHAVQHGDEYKTVCLNCGTTLEPFRDND